MLACHYFCSPNARLFDDSRAHCCHTRRPWTSPLTCVLVVKLQPTVYNPDKHKTTPASGCLAALVRPPWTIQERERGGAEEAAVPGGDDQTPGEPVRVGARQRRAELQERRSIQTTCAPPHVACARRRIPPQQLSRRLLSSRTRVAPELGLMLPACGGFATWLFCK